MARRPYKFCANRPCSSWWNVKVEVAQQRLTRSRQLIFLFKRFLSNQSMCRRLYGVLMIFGVKTYKTPGVPENKPHEQWVPHARRQWIPTMKNACGPHGPINWIPSKLQYAPRSSITASATDRVQAPRRCQSHYYHPSVPEHTGKA